MLQTGTYAQKQKATIALMEMQSMMPSASAENQLVIRDALTQAGVDYNETGISVDEQLSRRLVHGQDWQTTRGTAPGGFVPAGREGSTAEALRRKARVYDRDTEMLQRQAGG